MAGRPEGIGGDAFNSVCATDNQWHKMMDYLSSDHEMLTKEFQGVNGNAQLHAKWNELAIIVNQHGPAKKSGEKWKEAWDNLRTRAKRQYQQRVGYAWGTGGGVHPDLKGLRISDLYARVLTLINKKCLDGMPQIPDPLHMQIQDENESEQRDNDVVNQPVHSVHQHQGTVHNQAQPHRLNMPLNNNFVQQQPFMGVSTRANLQDQQPTTLINQAPQNLIQNESHGQGHYQTSPFNAGAAGPVQNLIQNVSHGQGNYWASPLNAGAAGPVHNLIQNESHGQGNYRASPLNAGAAGPVQNLIQNESHGQGNYRASPLNAGAAGPVQNLIQNESHGQGHFRASPLNAGAAGPVENHMQGHYRTSPFNAGAAGPVPTPRNSSLSSNPHYQQPTPTMPVCQAPSHPTQKTLQGSYHTLQSNAVSARPVSTPPTQPFSKNGIPQYQQATMPIIRGPHNPTQQVIGHCDYNNFQVNAGPVSTPGNPQQRHGVVYDATPQQTAPMKVVRKEEYHRAPVVTTNPHHQQQCTLNSSLVTNDAGAEQQSPINCNSKKVHTPPSKPSPFRKKLFNKRQTESAEDLSMSSGFESLAIGSSQSSTDGLIENLQMVSASVNSCVTALEDFSDNMNVTITSHTSGLCDLKGSVDKLTDALQNFDLI